VGTSSDRPAVGDTAKGMLRVEFDSATSSNYTVWVNKDGTTTGWEEFAFLDPTTASLQLSMGAYLLSPISETGLSNQSGKFLSTNGSQVLWGDVPDQLPSQSGNNDRVLTTDGTNASWELVPTELPSQSENSGRYLFTDGTSPSWGSLPAELPSQSGNSGRILFTDGTSPNWGYVPMELPSQSGNSGRYLFTNGSQVLWANVVTPDELPSQSENAGKYLVTDGTNPSWGSLPTELPSQSGNSGRYLFTNGSQVLWANVITPDELPSQGENAGKYLVTDGTNPSWGSLPTELPAQNTGTTNKYLRSNGSIAAWTDTPFYQESDTVYKIKFLTWSDSDSGSATSTNWASIVNKTYVKTAGTKVAVEASFEYDVAGWGADSFESRLTIYWGASSTGLNGGVTYGEAVSLKYEGNYTGGSHRSSTLTECVVLSDAVKNSAYGSITCYLDVRRDTADDTVAIKQGYFKVTETWA